MSDLTGKKIANTYKDLLQINSSASNDGLDETLRRVQDGAGNNSPLKLSQTSAAFTGNVSIAGSLIVQGAFQPSNLQTTNIVATSITTEGLNATNLIFQNVSVSSLRTGDLFAATVSAGTVSATTVAATNITLAGEPVATSAGLATVSSTMATSIANVSAALETRIATVSAITSSNAVAIANLSAGEILTRLKTVDGSGSGLDADLFDGLSSGVFLRSSQSDTMNGTLTVTGNVTASAFYGDGSNLTGIVVNTTAVNANTSAIAVNTSAIAVNTSAITSINNVVSALNSVVADVNASAIAANAQAIALANTSIAANASTVAINLAAITSVNTIAVNNVSAIAAVSALTSVNTAAITSINNVVSALNSVVADVNASAIAANTSAIAVNTSVIAAVSALTSINVAAIASVNTIATDAMPKSGGAFTGQVITNGNVSAKFYGPVDFNNYGILVSSNALAVFKGPARFQGTGGQSAIQLGNSSTQYIDGVARWGTGLIPTSTATYNFGNDSLRWNTAFITEFIGGINAALTSVSDILAGDNSSKPVNSSWVQGRLATKASVGTSAALQPSITANTSAIVSVNTVLSAVQTSITANASAITSVNTRINAVSVLAASVSSTMAASIDNQMPKAGGTFTGDVLFDDGQSAKFGNPFGGGNLIINGNTSTLGATGTLIQGKAGVLNIKNDSNIKLSPKAGELGIVIATNSAVDLYYNNSKKLATTSIGIHVSGAVSATSFYGDGSNLTGIAAGASAGTSATLQTNINTVSAAVSANTSAIAALSATMATSINNSNTARATLSATMATSINNRTAAITSVNTRINAVSVLTGTNLSAITSINNVVSALNSVVAEVNASAIAANAQAIAVANTSIAANASTVAINLAAITSVNNLAVANTSSIAALSATMATSIGNSNTAIATLSATMATSIGNSNTAIATLSATMATSISNHLPLAGGTVTGDVSFQGSSITLGNSMNDRIYGSALFARDIIPSSATDRYLGDTSRPWNFAYLGAVVADNITVSGNVTAASFYGDGSNLTGITAGASVGTSATLQTKIAAVSSTMATSISNSNTAIATLSATMATSINNRTAAITSVNTRINAVSVLAASVSSTMATSIGNSNTAIATLSATMATSISNHLPLTGGTVTGNVSFHGTNITLGNSMSDRIYGSALFARDIIPSSATNRYLGDTSRPWNFAYLGDVVADNITVSGTVSANTIAVSTATINDKAIFSTSATNGLQLYHDGSTNAYITASATNNDIHIAAASDIFLKYGNAVRLQTHSTGVYLAGTAIFDAAEFGGTVVVCAGNVELVDNSKVILGTGNDLQIYHDGSNSYIRDIGTGNLNILADELKIMNAAGTENKAFFVSDGGSYLYHNNSAKLETTSSGISITGIVSASGDIVSGGNISGVTKSFDIEHPTKEGMRLHHGVLEGPEHAVYIRGKSSSSVIELPDYWKGLVHEDTITVQLTPVGIYDKLYVEEIKDNKVTVYNNSEYFYFITGERKDIERFEVEYGDS